MYRCHHDFDFRAKTMKNKALYIQKKTRLYRPRWSRHLFFEVAQVKKKNEKIWDFSGESKTFLF